WHKIAARSATVRSVIPFSSSAQGMLASRWIFWYLASTQSCTNSRALEGGNRCFISPWERPKVLPAEQHSLRWQSGAFRRGINEIRELVGSQTGITAKLIDLA